MEITEEKTMTTKYMNYQINKSKTTRKVYFWLVSIFLVLFTIAFISTSLKNNARANVFDNLPLELSEFKESDLKQYNGTYDNKPIYIGFNGYVYDVSQGREYYNQKGTYHYLAGRDSSKELNLVGGNLIKQKYPVIGKLIK